MDNDIIQSLEKKMQKTIEWLELELSGLQVGRANRSLVENIQVDAWYWVMNIGQLANITIPDSLTIRIEPWDKSLVSKIEKAIYDSEVGLTPQNNWDYLFLKIPPLTTERRKEVAKQVSWIWEEAKKRLRQARQDAKNHVKKIFEEKEISEDQKKWLENDIDDVTKKYTDQIDSMIKAKQNEILNW